MDMFMWFFYVVCPLVGLVFMLTAPWLIPLIWLRLIPKPARTLTWASRKKQPPAIIVHDSGRAAVTLIKERRGEGVVVTDRGKYKLLPRYIGLGTETETEQEGKKKGKNPNGEDKKVTRVLKNFRDWVTKRAILTGLNMPIYFGYSGSLCLLNPEALALYEAGEMKVQTPEGVFDFNPEKKRNKKIEDAVQPLMLLDPRAIKAIINRTFDTTQISSIVEDAIELGRLGRPFNKTLLGILAVGLVVGVAILAFVMLGPQMGLM